MRFIVEIKPSGQILLVNEGETILQAAMRHELHFPFNCQMGTCGTCRGRLLQGEVTYPHTQPEALTGDEREAGYVLFCLAVPLTDLIIEVDDVMGPEDLPKRQVNYSVTQMVALAPNITQVILTAPANQHIHYRAGQYLYLVNQHGERYPFSIANAPLGGHHLELHLHQNPENQVIAPLLQLMQQQQAITVEAPFGRSIYRKEPQLPTILLAGGSGFTHIKAIIEQAIASENQHPLHLYWGTRREHGLYLHSLVENWTRGYDFFHYTPVISMPQKNPHWQGATGLVHEAVLADYPDLSDYQVFASGPQEMVIAALQHFQARGMKKVFMHSDVFEFIDV